MRASHLNARKPPYRTAGFCFRWTDLLCTSYVVAPWEVVPGSPSCRGRGLPDRKLQRSDARPEAAISHRLRLRAQHRHQRDQKRTTAVQVSSPDAPRRSLEALAHMLVEIVQYLHCGLGAIN